MPNDEIVNISDRLKGCNPLPTLLENTIPIPPGKYYFECTQLDSLTSSMGAETERKVWFASPRFDMDIIKRIKAVQLVAESHDQGKADDPAAGNWTWFELGILNTWLRLADDTVKESLTWKSHSNRFLTESFGWKEGTVFDETHDMMTMLREGDRIAVLLCARFRGWRIEACRGFLFITLAQEQCELQRSPPPPYQEAVLRVKDIQSTLQKANPKSKTTVESPQPETSFTSVEELGDRKAPPLRVLSLDGGGVRGIASLLLLKEFMERSAPGRQPWEVFDLIGGTSTGGLIAIMLGRLRMSVDDCIRTYESFMTRIFHTCPLKKFWSFLLHGYFYPVEALERLIKDLIAEKLPMAGEDALLFEGDPRCKVLCISVHQEAVNNYAPVMIRSYIGPEGTESKLLRIKIWEAARATSAAPAYFKHIQVGNMKLIDGGVAANNPLGWVWNEATTIFGPMRPIGCILSIGTGISPNVKLTRFRIWGSHAVEKAWVAAATNTETVHSLFQPIIDSSPPISTHKYFRLNVSKTVHAAKPGQLSSYATVGDLDDTRSIEQLRRMTDDYISKKEVLLKSAADAMRRTLTSRRDRRDHSTAPSMSRFGNPDVEEFVEEQGGRVESEHQQQMEANVNEASRASTPAANRVSLGDAVDAFKFDETLKPIPTPTQDSVLETQGRWVN